MRALLKIDKTGRANGSAMGKLIQIFFPDLNEGVLIELDDSRSPKTVKGLLDSLPIEVKINKWVKNSILTRSQLRYRRRMQNQNLIY
jgi:hypothetical protein